MPPHHEHVVSIDAETARLTIYRVHGDGTRILYTSIELPTPPNTKQALRSFCAKLGESLLLDSPVGRKLLDL